MPDVPSLIRTHLDAGRVAQAIELGEDAAASSSGVDRAAVLVALSCAQSSSAQALAAFKSASEAGELFRQHHDRRGEVEAEHAAAIAFQTIDDHASALATLEHAEALANELGHEVLLAETQRLIGVSCSVLGRDQQALAYLESAEATLTRVGSAIQSLRGRTSLLNGRARRAERMPRNDPARLAAYQAELPRWAQLAADAAREKANRLEVMARSNYAICAREAGRHDEAVRELKGLITRYRDYGMAANEVVAQNHLGAALASTGRIEEAKAAFLTALDLLKNGGSLRESRIAWNGLSVIHEKLGATKPALDALRKAVDIDRQLREQEARDRASQREVRLEMSRMTGELSRLAAQDAMTGLANRRALETWLNAALAREPHSATISVLMFDIDHLKVINDGFGHLTGDAILRQIAELLRSGTRPSDLPARCGGEEFVVALASTDFDGAVELALRLTSSIQDFDWNAIASGLKVSVSVGVAAAAEAPDTNSLLALAERRLYAAKRGGRNRVVS